MPLNFINGSAHGSIHNPVPSVGESSIANNSVQSSIPRPGDIILPSGNILSSHYQDQGVEQASRISGSGEYRESVPVVTSVVRDTISPDGSIQREVTEFVDHRITPGAVSVPIQPAVVSTVT